MINFTSRRRMPATVRRHPPVALPYVTATGRICAVDGLRALAVSGVMAFHFGLGVPGGFLGVDLFFVISGYVITRLLLIEWQRTGAIGWARFWGLRARRLLPAVMVVLIAAQMWLRLGAPPELRTTTNAQTIAALTYVSNWYAIVADVGYWGAQTDATPLTHLWSLAVEEQFYLAWPLLLIVVLAFSRSRPVVAVVAGVGAAASYLTGSVLFHTAGTDRAYLGTDARAGALLLGVLCALALTRLAPGPDGSWDRLLTPRLLTAAQATFVLAVAALALLWATAGIHAPWLYEGGLGIAGISAVLVIAYLVAVPGSAPARLLGSRPMVQIGRLSYSLYLWHWPVHVYATHRWARLGRPLLIAGEIGTTLALSVLSFLLVEQPARKVRRAVVLALPLLACVLLILGSALCFQPKPPIEEQNGIIVHGPAR
jgi:peptidoglycan/LPS O-acetylase OafA/YrhL